jgi:hypothetical protein
MVAQSLLLTDQYQFSMLEACAAPGMAAPALNRDAYTLRCGCRLEVIPSTTHLFAEPGTLDAVVTLVMTWFMTHPATPAAETESDVR